jgi:hypothetical protein
MKRQFWTRNLQDPFLILNVPKFLQFECLQNNPIIMNRIQGIGSQNFVLRAFDGFKSRIPAGYVPLEARAQGTESDGLSSVLLGDHTVLESQFPSLKGAD